MRSGGSTSVDITQRGIDKAYGMRQLAEQTGIPLEDMLFVGDRLDPDGNDYPVLAMGVPCHAVEGWEDTADFLESSSPPCPRAELTSRRSRQARRADARAARAPAPAGWRAAPAA